MASVFMAANDAGTSEDAISSTSEDASNKDAIPGTSEDASNKRNVRFMFFKMPYK
jgi:hypothetical protein